MFEIFSMGGEQNIKTEIVSITFRGESVVGA